MTEPKAPVTEEMVEAALKAWGEAWYTAPRPNDTRFILRAALEAARQADPLAEENLFAAFCAGFEASAPDWNGDLFHAVAENPSLEAQVRVAFDEWRAALSQPVPEQTECGRLLVGQGSDTYDPTCTLPRGHKDICRPAPEQKEKR